MFKHFNLERIYLALAVIGSIWFVLEHLVWHFSIMLFTAIFPQ